MRTCPEWFQAELARIGGTNPYGEPIFKLIWTKDPQWTRTIGGRFKDGYVGYRKLPEVAGEPCWALMVWEPQEMQGTPYRWEQDYRDPDTGLLDCGGYPKYGRYRLLQRFIHTEIVQQAKERHWMGKDGTLYRDITQKQVLKKYRMEPCGFILDVMVPMLKMWRKLSNEAKIKALQEEERMQNEEIIKKAKEIRRDCKVKRSWQLVQKRAELIEKGLKATMEVAARYGLGMAIG